MSKSFSFPNVGTCSRQTNIVLNDDHTIASMEVIGVVIVQHKVGLLGTGAAVREAEFLAHSSKSSLFDRNPDEDRLLLL